MAFFTLMMLKSHFFPGGRSLDYLLYLQESGVETKAIVSNLDDLPKGERTLKYSYVVKGETYQGIYTLKEELDPIELIAPVTYNLRRPKVHQYHLQEAIRRAKHHDERTLGWKFFLFPLGSFLMLYWGFGDLRKLKEEARAQDAV